MADPSRWVIRRKGEQMDEWTRNQTGYVKDYWDERYAQWAQDAWYDARRVAAAQKGEQNEQPIS